MRLVKARALAVVGCALLGLVGCGNEDPGAPAGSASPAAADVAADGVDVAPSGALIARVGAGGVTEEAFRDAAARTPPRDGLNLDEAERRELAEKLVTEEAFWQEAVKRGLYKDPKVRKIMVNLLLREEIYSNVRAADFDNEDLRKYFDEHREEFVVPEKVQIKRIFLTVDDKRTLDEAMSLARDLRAQLVGQPDKFKDLALQHSEDPYKRRGGDLGYLAREGKPGIDLAVVNTAFDLPINQVSEPFEAGGGVNLVMAANRRERVERTFEQMKGSVLRRMKNDRYKGLTDEFVNGIRAGMQVEIDDMALASLQLGPMQRGATDPYSAAEAAEGVEGDLGLPVDEFEEH